MYARLMTAAVPPAELEGRLAACAEQWLPALSQAQGFKALYVLRGGLSTLAALILWETEAEAALWEGGGEVMEVVLRA